MKKYDYIIIGAGLYGAVMAERLTSAGKRVLVIDRRNHVGGNCYSYNFDGLIVHKYGPHVFHTDDYSIWNYINRFSDFRRFTHSVKATHDGRVYDFPINLKTINDFYDVNIKPCDVNDFLNEMREGATGGSLEDAAIRAVGYDLYKAFIYGYTKKQWGIEPSQLPAEIVTRLPLRTDYNNSYFNDYFQGVPVNGYDCLFNNMFAGCDVLLNYDAIDSIDYFKKKCKKIIYTGPIDEFYGYCFGRLSWRSVMFTMDIEHAYDYQGTAVMHYPDVDVPFTRITESKHFHPAVNRKETILLTEYPVAGNIEPSHPVRRPGDIDVYNMYKELSDKEKNIIFGGRLAEYRYYDMDDVIKKALSDYEQIHKRK